MVHLCMVNVITDCDEKTVLKISGVSESDAMATAMRLINGVFSKKFSLFFVKCGNILQYCQT